METFDRAIADAINRDKFDFIFFHESPYPAYHLACPAVILNNLFENLVDLFQIGRLGRHKTQSGLGVAEDRGKRLIQLVRQ